MPQRSRARRLRRNLLLMGATAAVTRAVAQRRARMAAVDPDLRGPALWVPGSISNDRIVRAVRSLQQRMPHPPPVAGVTVDSRDTERRDGGRIQLLLHEPADRVRPSGALLWIHGGGLVIGVAEQSTPVCSRLARDLGVLVVAVEYRLAPEDPFPAGLDDCVDALRWVHDHAEELGIDPDRVAVGGDSAGGGLSAALCQRVVDEGGPRVALQALVYPMLDDRTVLRADHGGRGTFVWTPTSNAYGWTAYLGHPPQLDEPRPYAAPARRTDLHGLPPAWIGVGDLDLFYEEDLDYARRLEEAGVPCELHVVPGMFHGADNFATDAPACAGFHASLTAALRGALSRSGVRV